MLISLPKIKLKNPLADRSPEDRSTLAICLGIAFIFWLLVKLSKEYTVLREVVISYDLPLGKTFAQPPPAVIGVSLTSQGWNFLLASLLGRSYELSYEVPDRGNFILSIFQFRKDIEALLNDKDILITNVLFDGFNIQLEQQAVRLLPVVVSHRLSFTPEYSLVDSLHVLPDSIRVVGPISQLENLTVWRTDSLILENLNQSYEGTLALQTPEEGLRIEPVQVRVSVPVERYTEKRFFVPVEIRNAPADSIRIFPDKVLLICVLGLGHYNQLTAEDFTLIANLKRARFQDGKNTVTLELESQPDFLH
jgi:hypothetical protein